MVTSQMVLCHREISQAVPTHLNCCLEFLRRCVLGISAALWELWRIRGVTQQPIKHLGNGILVAFSNCGRPCALQSRMREWVTSINLESDIAFA